MSQTYDSSRSEPLLLRKREVVRLLGISARSVERLVAAGELPRVRIGAGAVRYRSSDVRELVERSREALSPP